MELEELKKSWSEYDKKLNENLRLNENLLRKMNLDKSKNEMQNLFILEIISVIIIFLTMPVVIGFSIQFINDITFSITGFTSVLIGVVYLVFSILKINKFTKIDYYNSKVIKLQKDISLLKTFILRLRKVELILLPFILITILPILYKAIHNINVFENLLPFIIEIGLALVIVYVVLYWFNKNIYDKKIKDVELFLSEISNFDREE